jgi:hypothetical protein
VGQFGSKAAVSYHCATMTWGKLFGTRREKLPVLAALCFGRADGSNPKFPAHEKHAILAIVRAPEPEAESVICVLLQSNGWREPEIENLKLLDQPFHSDDPVMRTCYESALSKDGGFVVYSDPIVEA